MQRILGFFLVVVALAFAPRLVGAAESGGEIFWQDNDYRGLAPGADQPEQPGQLTRLGYYQWIFPLFPVDEDPELLSIIQEEAKEEATEEEPEALRLKILLEEAFTESKTAAVGKHLPVVWDWYEAEVGYETPAGKEAWARQQAAVAQASEAVRAENADFYAFYEAMRAEFIKFQKLLGEQLAAGAFDSGGGPLMKPLEAAVPAEFVSDAMPGALDLAKLAAKKRSLDADVKERAQELLAEVDATAMAPFLEQAQASPTFTPEVLAKINADKNNIYLDLYVPAKETYEMEMAGAITENTAVAFDAYAIIDAKVSDVAKNFWYRSGIPVAGAGTEPTTTYPTNGLYGYHQETAYPKTEEWGPMAFLDYGLTAGSLIPQVKPQSTFSILLNRGNERDGYDVVLHHLGTACPADGPLPPELCTSVVTSNFTVMILRPLPDGRTAYKIRARYTGQSYTFKAAQGMNYMLQYEGQQRFATESEELTKTGQLANREAKLKDYTVEQIRDLFR